MRKIMRYSAVFCRRLRIWVRVLAVVFFVLTHVTSAAADSTEQQELVDKARITIDSFLVDSDLSWFREHVKEAKALLIMPQLLKAGFIIGGSGGSGVLLVHDEETSEWSEPAFYTLGSGSIGFQIGAQASEVVLMVMTENGVESLLSTTLKLGADATIAVGPIGVGIEGATAPNLSADFISFSRSKGLFAGLSLEGAVIAARNEWNSDYYGEPVRPVDILVRHNVSHRKTAELRAVVTKATSGR